MISSKIRLNGSSGQYIEITLDADLIHLSDKEFEFVMSIINWFREYVKRRNETDHD